MSRSRDLLGRLTRDADDDSGFVLPFVMLIMVLIMIGTATALGVVANNAVPAKHSQDQETALAAAQAGVQTYIAQLDANCNSYTIGECQWPYNTAAAAARTVLSGVNGSPTLTGAGFTVAATNAQGFLSKNNDDLRVLSTGCVPTCTATKRTTSTLLADISGVPNVLRYAYFTNYETFSAGLMTSLYPSRTVPLSAAIASVVGSTSLLGTSVAWGGATNAATCNQHWYDGRSTGTNDIVAETATTLPTGLTGPVTSAHPCSVTFSKGMNFVGPVYSQDALYLSNGYPQSGDASTWTGPAFSVPTPCSTTVTSNCEPLPPASTAWTGAMDPTKPYRSFADPLGGSPATAGSVQVSPLPLSLPTSASDATATCTTTGDVAITFTGAGATLSGATGTCGTSLANLTQTTVLVKGNASVSGSVTTGRVSVVAVPNGTSLGDIVVTGSLTSAGSQAANTTTNQFGEPSIKAGSSAGAIDLVATNDVVIKHNVTCASGGQTVTDFASCANDISGLYSTAQSAEVVDPKTGVLKASHPARQYCNVTGTTTCGSASAACDTSSTSGLQIQAAIFALNGSFRTANFNRGCAMGTVDVTGGIYQSHRGPLGQEWEISSTTAATARPFSGYRLKLTYESLQYAGLPYVPALLGGTPNHPWLLVSVSTSNQGN